tara:strand:- start:114 stop:491 length:378 start_codon:yes stop_codon:yes gene_type:complete
LFVTTYQEERGGVVDFAKDGRILVDLGCNEGEELGGRIWGKLAVAVAIVVVIAVAVAVAVDVGTDKLDDVRILGRALLHGGLMEKRLSRNSKIQRSICMLLLPSWAETTYTPLYITTQEQNSFRN